MKWYKKYQHLEKYVTLVKCVKEHSFGNFKEHKLAEQNRLLEKFYAEVKNKNNLPALPLCKFFYVYIVNM